MFGKYCGHMTGKTVLVSGRYALIELHSEGRNESKGFVMSFTAVVPPRKKTQFSRVYAFMIVIITL